MDTFDTSEEFFDWYLGEISKYVPKFDALVRARDWGYLSRKLPPLSSDEINFMFARIREIFKIRKGVYLVYEPYEVTYYSRYNPNKKRLEIGVPRTAFYHLRYPPIIDAAMQHEMGHILNRDYKVNIPNHIGCVNKCMDIRINHHIDRTNLRHLYDATYYFKTKGDNFKMLVPEDVLEDFGMPLKKFGTYSFEQIHRNYHLNDNEEEATKQPKEDPTIIIPEIGDIVQINKTKEYGQVVDVNGNQVEIIEISQEDVNEHFRKIKDSYYQ